MLKALIFLKNTNWSLKTLSLMSNFPERPPTPCGPCILGNSHNNLCPMSGKECRFHLLYDLGDGGLVTKNVCAYFQSWYHDGPSTAICWVPTSWRRRVLSLEDAEGREVGHIFSSLGLPFLRPRSGWGEAAHSLGHRPAPACRMQVSEGSPGSDAGHKNTRLQNGHVLYLRRIKYELGLQKGSRGQTIASMWRKRVFHLSLLPHWYLRPLICKPQVIKGPTSGEWILWDLEWCLRHTPYCSEANESRQARWCMLDPK